MSVKDLPPSLPPIPLGSEAHKAYLESLASPDEFWSRAAQAFHWETGFSAARRDNSSPPVWFAGGRTNLAYNCVDRHVEGGQGSRAAFILEPARPKIESASTTITYDHLQQLVSKAAKVLRDMGVRRGDHVAILLPARLELPVAMLACARIGAVHATLSPRLGTEALAARLADLRPDVLITMTSKSSSSPVWRVASDALAAARARAGGHARKVAPKGLLVNPVRRGFDKAFDAEEAESTEVEGTMWADWEASVARADAASPLMWVNAEDSAYVVFPDSAGASATAASPAELAAGGRPLGLMYPVGGALVGAATGFRQVMGLEEARDEVLWYAAPDVGGVEAAYLAYGPTAWGRTQLLVEEGAEEIEGVVGHEAGTSGCCGVCGGCIGVGARVWELVEKHRVGRVLVPSAQARRWRVAEEELCQSPVVAARRSGSDLEGGPAAAPLPPLRWRYALGSLRRVVTYGEAPDADTWQWLRHTVLNLCSVPAPARRGAAISPAGMVRRRAGSVASAASAWGTAEAGGFLLVSAPGSPAAGPAMRPLDGVDAALLAPSGCEVGGPGEGFLVMRGAGRPGRATRPLAAERDALRFEAVACGLAGWHGGWIVPPPSDPGARVSPWAKLGPMFVTRELCRRGMGGGLAPAGRVGEELARVNGKWQDVAEVERALASHPQVAEAAVAAFPHPRRGQGLCAFVALREDRDAARSSWASSGVRVSDSGDEAAPELTAELRAQLCQAVVRRVGRFASPDLLVHVPRLPRSREGRLLRGPLRRAAQEAVAAAAAAAEAEVDEEYLDGYILAGKRTWA